FELTANVPITPHGSPLPGGYIPGSDEGRLKLEELMTMCTKLSKQLEAEEESTMAFELIKFIKSMLEEYQSNLEGLVSNFMASQDVRLSKFEADFKQQQSKMTNKIDTVLKAITYRMAGALPSDTVKNPKLNVNTTTLVLYARSYPTEDLQCSTHIYGSINAVTIYPKQQSDSHDDEPAESKEEGKDSPENTNTKPSASPNPSISFITKKVRKLNSFFESLSLAP
ncbi:hypothetical protein Tco_1506827, partial [Tanacetum coccineum]